MLAIVGGLTGLLVALMLAFPLSLLGDPLGIVVPAIVSLACGFLGMSAFAMRSAEILEIINERIIGRQRRLQSFSARKLLLDTRRID